MNGGAESGRAPELSVVSLPGFPAGVIVWEPEAGHRSLTVVVKATFALTPGEVTLARDQDPLREERHWDGNVLSSLHWPGDFAPSKRKVDVSLVGHAYAPRGAVATELIAKLTVGELQKAVRVTGDRAWVVDEAQGLAPGPPAQFTRIPLRYERASLSADNPVGFDPAAPPVLGAPALPNLERVERGGAPCFGPVAPTWRARRRILDDLATFWAYGVARDPRVAGPPPGPPPPRFDFSFFNAAPPDQQIDLLRPGTPLELENLHPDHPHLVTRVPAVRPQVFVVPRPGASGRVEEIILRCDSLWIDTDAAVLVLAWRGVAEAAAPATLVVASDPAGKKLKWPQVEKRLGERNAPTLRIGPGGALPTQEDFGGPDLLGRRYDAIKGGGDTDVLVIPQADLGLDEPTARNIPPRKPGAPAPVEDEVTVDKAERDPDANTTQRRVRAARGAAAQTAQVPRSTRFTLRKDLTLARCAEIAANLAEPGADRAALLRASMLTEASWALVDKHWKKVIAEEAETGASTTQDAFDDATVAAAERRAPPIDRAAYARLCVGVERGEVGGVLADLGLELADFVRLQRVWERRTASSPDAAAELARAIADARRT